MSRIHSALRQVESGGVATEVAPVDYGEDKEPPVSAVVDAIFSGKFRRKEKELQPEPVLLEPLEPVAEPEPRDHSETTVLALGALALVVVSGSLGYLLGTRKNGA